MLRFLLAIITIFALSAHAGKKKDWNFQKIDYQSQSYRTSFKHEGNDFSIYLAYKSTHLGTGWWVTMKVFKYQKQAQSVEPMIELIHTGGQDGLNFLTAVNKTKKRFLEQIPTYKMYGTK